ncbi:preprotein translocase subunit YajC [bacterium]|nr:preprotein translocase subunit YajC [bacterium]
MNDFFQVMAALPSQATGGAGKAADPMSGLMSFLPIVIIFVLFYVLFILPQRKQQKQHNALLKTLKKGDEVMTSGGMFGSISGINEKENTVYLKMGEGVKIEIQRSSISGLRKSNPTGQAAK